MKVTIATVATYLLVGTSSVLAMPAAAPDTGMLYSGMGVFIRGDDGSYAHSEEMAEVIRSRNDAAGILKRGSANVQACTTSSCTNCRTIFSGSLSSNSACLGAANTQCLIVSNLEDANVVFWNNAGCDGNRSVDGSCGQGTQHVSAPGTKSVGVHTGC